VVDEIDNLPFRPIPVILAISLADEPAVPAVAADAQLDVRIGRDSRIPERLDRYEWIVFRGDDERGDADAIDDAHRARAVVIVGRVAEAEVRRRDALVELAHGADRAERRPVERSSLQPRLRAHPTLQVADEVPLVQRVLRPLERARALLDL